MLVLSSRLAALSFLLATAALLSGCKSSDAGGGPGPAPAGTCGALFGNPNDKTGLGSDQCGPSCACGADAFAPPAYDAAFVTSLVSDWQLATPYGDLASDPYAAPAPADDPAGTVCAVLAQGDAAARPRAYALVTYGSEDEARAAGASVTHFGHCGVCSTLANLAVYMGTNDLTAPVRACGLEPAAVDGGDADVACLEQLGFDRPCAQVWAYDTAHTRGVCLATCLGTLNDPYNTPDGGLNPCIQCDEDQSGPVFKSVAGRTRRNSGLPNAICRPCSEVRPLVHRY